jgi:hypothetical protein
MITLQDPNKKKTATESPATRYSSIWAILLGVFMDPIRTFSALKEKPRIMIPLLIIFIISIAISIASSRYSIILQFDMLAKSRRMPLELLNAIREGALTASPVPGAIISGLSVIGFNLSSAMIAFFIGVMIFGSQARFKAVWSVGLVATEIKISGGILLLPLIFLKKSMLVSYGMAAFLPTRDFSSVTYTIFYQCDIFTIWSIIVAGIGYAIVFGLSRSRSMKISIIASGLPILASIFIRIVGLAAAGVRIDFL